MLHYLTLVPYFSRTTCTHSRFAGPNRKQVVSRAPPPLRERPGTLEKTRETEKSVLLPAPGVLSGEANRSALRLPLRALAPEPPPCARCVSGSELHPRCQRSELCGVLRGAQRAHRGAASPQTTAQVPPGGNPSPVGEEGSCFPPGGTFHLKSFHKGCSRLRLREEL